MWDLDIFATSKCQSGGIGRRARLKIVFFREWGFDSLLWYLNLSDFTSDKFSFHQQFLVIFLSHYQFETTMLAFWQSQYNMDQFCIFNASADHLPVPCILLLKNTLEACLQTKLSPRSKSLLKIKSLCIYLNGLPIANGCAYRKHWIDLFINKEIHNLKSQKFYLWYSK